MEVREIKSFVVFEIGDIVFHRATGLRGVVVSFSVDKRDVTYVVAWSPFEKTTCYSTELSHKVPDGLLEVEEEDND